MHVGKAWSSINQVFYRIGKNAVRIECFYFKLLKAQFITDSQGSVPKINDL